MSFHCRASATCCAMLLNSTLGGFAPLSDKNVTGQAASRLSAHSFFESQVQLGYNDV